MRVAKALTVAIFGLIVSHGARAEVVSADANGFSVRESAQISTTPDKTYAAIVAPSRWWNSKHTYSGLAANLTLDPRAGGCWCESLAGGGSVQHLIVVFASPGKTLRLRGALGPLQGLGVDGAMTWNTKSDANGSSVELTYTVGGYSRNGLDKLANAVDGVLAEQVLRLKSFIETGTPEEKASH